MSKRYYLDTCIWRDFYEDRFGPEGRPLGKYAARLIFKILKEEGIVFFSEVVIRELENHFDNVHVNEMFMTLRAVGTLKYLILPDKIILESKEISKQRKIPWPDVLHALLARDNEAILISQDKHFSLLGDIIEWKRPDELI